MNGPLSLALSKGRLFDQVIGYFARSGLDLHFGERKLVGRDQEGLIEAILVKNADLPTYLHHGIAGLGICGEDVLYERGDDLVRLLELPFGTTTMVLAAREGTPPPAGGPVEVATKFVRFTHDHFHARGVPVRIIRLDGSVELAPVLGLAPFIVDLMETGSTLRAHQLAVVEELKKVRVWLVANRAYWKWHYRDIRELIQRLSQADEHSRR